MAVVYVCSAIGLPQLDAKDNATTSELLIEVPLMVNTSARGDGTDERTVVGVKERGVPAPSAASVDMGSRANISMTRREWDHIPTKNKKMDMMRSTAERGIGAEAARCDLSDDFFMAVGNCRGKQKKGMSARRDRPTCRRENQKEKEKKKKKRGEWEEGTQIGI